MDCKSGGSGKAHLLGKGRLLGAGLRWAQRTLGAQAQGQEVREGTPPGRPSHACGGEGTGSGSAPGRVGEMTGCSAEWPWAPPPSRAQRLEGWPRVPSRLAPLLWGRRGLGPSREMAVPPPGMRRVKLLLLSHLQKLRELCEFGENEGEDGHVHLLGPRRRAWDGWWTRKRALWPRCWRGRMEHSKGKAGVGQRAIPASRPQGVRVCRLVATMEAGLLALETAGGQHCPRS